MRWFRGSTYTTPPSWTHLKMCVCVSVTPPSRALSCRLLALTCSCREQRTPCYHHLKICGAPVRLICKQQPSTLLPPHWTTIVLCPVSVCTRVGHIKLLAQTGPMVEGFDKQDLAAEQEPPQAHANAGDARELRVALARTIGALRNACVGAASSTAELLGGEDPTGFAEVRVWCWTAVTTTFLRRTSVLGSQLG